ncbi:hypothetical protein GCM10010873_26540 [Cypionkella aquatica]|uniref:Tip attachment protein J domain-containing protein n=1 Tax=Cypionkella aquatica TaxID=1756042 RepID=A0AA37X2L7_9RHOB|nr:hypothetical protein [Cypionkella aquatica]GLS87680.1 hypothetical protein GCM10010873_26540 [Cypionkella aquatica]
MAIFTLITAGLASAGFTGAITIFGLSPALSAALISVGKSLLWSEVSKALGPKAPTIQVQASIAQATAPRVRGYGEYMLGGVKVLREAKSKRLYQITSAHHGAISEVVRFEVDGEVVTLSGGAVTSGSADGYMWIYAILSGDGGDYAEARAAFPSMWTTAHKLTGQASYFVVMKAPKIAKLSKRFPRQAETSVQMVAKLSQVMDPRTGVTAYSDLTGPAALDFLTHPDGYRIPMESVDLASFAQFTAVCDQDVPLKAGGSEKRYRLGGYYTLEDAPKEVMQRILATADAQLYMTAEGKCGILGGSWEDPDVTIGAADILAMQLADGFDEFTDFNVLKGKYTSPLHRFQEAEAEELLDETALLTQPERVETLAVDLCPSPSQMRRLMYLYRASSIRDWTGTIRTNLVGLKARYPKGKGKHVIRIVNPALPGIGDAVFEVLSHSYSVADRVCEISIASIVNAYPWNPAAQEGTPPPPLSALAVPGAATFAPTGLVLTQDVVALASGQNAARIEAVVDEPDYEGVQLYLEYRRVGVTEWEPMVVGVGNLRGASAVVSSGLTYQVRASWVGEDIYTAIETITVISNPTPPSAAASLTLSYSAPDITLDWVNGVSGYYRTRIYRGSSASFGAASILGTVAGIAGQPQALVDTPGAGTWYYWAVTINASGIEQITPTGPVSQTI